MPSPQTASASSIPSVVITGSSTGIGAATALHLDRLGWRVFAGVRRADDGAALLASHPAITTLVAAGLAERLNFVTSYLVDLKHQYGDAPGLAMIPDVLRELSQRQRPKAQPGSMRDPDPEY